MGPHDQDLDHAIASAFPHVPGLAVLGAAIPADVPALFAGEEDAVARATPKRVREYATARALARHAMTRLGLAPAAILRGAAREPVWPPGAVGSLSHAEDIAVAAVARVGSVRAVGIDLEVADRVRERLFDKLFSTEEQRFIGAQPDPARVATLAFSAKEAGYKATHALAGRFIAFRDALIEIDTERRTFRFRYRGGHAPSGIMEAGEGYYLFHERYVLSLFIIR